MRLGTAAILLGLATATTPAMATVIPGIHNTGTDANTDGKDDYWTLNGTNAFIGTPINSAWQPNDSTSSWLTPTSNGNASLDPTTNGQYTYSLTFDLTGLDPKSAYLSGIFAVDNTVNQILLNGNPLSFSGSDVCCSFTTGGAFSASSGFVAGSNTLSFVTTNIAQATGNPAGLRVQFSQAVASVPEPISWSLMILGFGLIGAMTRRQRQSDLSYI